MRELRGCLEVHYAAQSTVWHSTTSSLYFLISFGVIDVNNSVLVAMVMLSGVALAVAYSHSSGSQSAPLLNWKDAAVVARGEALYKDHCTACHGAIGDARSSDETRGPNALAPSHDSDGHTWEHPDYILVQLTKSGEVAELCRTIGDSDMPEFGQSLSDRQIVDVLSYIKSTWPEDILAKQEEVNRLYEGQNSAVREMLDLSET